MNSIKFSRFISLTKLLDPENVISSTFSSVQT